jgi:hypothetical protein
VGYLILHAWQKEQQELASRHIKQHARVEAMVESGNTKWQMAKMMITIFQPIRLIR